MSAGGLSLGASTTNITCEVASTVPISNNGSGSGSANISGSAGSGVSTTTSVSSKAGDDLPKSSYDGSHLDWKAFRRDVLAPHRICVIEGPPSHALPESLIALIEASQGDVGKFDDQKKSFREQVVAGRGFGPSPLFPPNLLPSIDNEPKLARCMVPAFNREALPERLANYNGPFFELSKPRSGLGCGFSHAAFTDQEINKIPHHLVANGTVVRFDTGYIGPGASLISPFLVFERTFGKKEQRLETANNQCAIAGAWCTRSLQMLYAQAWSPSDKDRPDFPVSFSCTIDNEIAIINYHWIDNSQTYCMSPVCKFDLGNDEHFNQFNIWIEAIGQWGVRTLLPVVKRALLCLKKPISPRLDTGSPLGKPDLKIDTLLQEEKLVTALKDTFSSIPWRLEDDDFTPVSSSVASWGSPIINEFFYTNLQYPSVPRLRSSAKSSATSSSGRSLTDLKLSGATTIVAPPRPQAPLRRFKVSTPLTPTAFSFSSNNSGTGGMTPPPSYVGPNAELACQKRLSHAMDEIQDLQAQLQRLRQEMNGLNTSYQTELSGLKNTVNTLLHKVASQPSTGAQVHRPRSLSTNSTSVTVLETSTTTSTTNISPTTKDVYTDLQQARQLSQATVVTTPTEPKPKSYPWDRLRSQRTRSSLQQVMTVNTSMEGTPTLDKEKCCPEEEDEREKLAEKTASKPVLTEVPLPTPSAKSAPSSAKFLRFPLTPGPISAAFPSPAFSLRSDATNVLVVPPPPPKPLDVLKWTAALLGTQTLGTFIPSTVLRIVFLGCITDFALLAFASPHWPSTTRYFMELLKG